MSNPSAPDGVKPSHITKPKFYGVDRCHPFMDLKDNELSFQDNNLTHQRQFSFYTCKYKSCLKSVSQLIL